MGIFLIVGIIQITKGISQLPEPKWFIEKLMVYKYVTQNFAEADIHAHHLSGSISSQKTIIGVSLKDSDVQTVETTKCRDKRFKSGKEEQINSFQTDCEEHHQSLLRKTILCSYISSKIFLHLEPMDAARAAQFAFL